MVKKDPNARFAVGGPGIVLLNALAAHPYFKDVTFNDSHLNARPLPTLQETCLIYIGRRWAKLRDRAMAFSSSTEDLTQHTRDVLARFEFLSVTRAHYESEASTSSG